MDEIKDELGVTMNYTGTDEHVPEAERNNQTIAECIRVAYHWLPYKTVPKVMLRYLAMICTKQLNIFPAKGGVMPYYSPHVLINGRQYDYEKDCQVEFGDYVQANNSLKITNTNAPHTIDGIYL